MKHDDTRPKVYVSYSRAVEEKIKLFGPMQEALDDVLFMVDTDKVKYRDNFEDFIKAIGEAKHLFIVLSQKYLQSFYCMYELLSIYKKGDLNGVISLNDRIFFVREDGLRLDDENTRREIGDYWSTVLGHRKTGVNGGDGYTSSGTLDEVSELNTEMEGLLNAFHRICSPDIEELRSDQLLENSTFELVRAWLHAVRPKSLPNRKVLDADEYSQLLETNIAKKLRPHEYLLELLATDLNCDQNVNAVAKEIVNFKDFADLLDSHINTACSQALNKVTGEGRAALRSDLWDIVSWLKGIAIQKKKLSEASSTQFDNVKATPASTSFGVAAIVDGHAKAPTRVKLEKGGVFASLDQLRPAKQESWDDHGIGLAQKFVAFAYSVIMGAHQSDDAFDENGILKLGERKKLNSRILGSAKRMHANYHAILSEGIEWDFMLNKQVLMEMQRLLPAFDFYFQQEDRLDSADFFKGEESALHDAFTIFFETVLGDA